MSWKQLELTPAHFTYLVLGGFLLTFTSVAKRLRDRYHLSEPPFAMLVGIIFGPEILGVLVPNNCGSRGCGWQESWGWGDGEIQELTRIVVGIQVFAVGLSLPPAHFKRHWKSVAWLLVPNMTISWLICMGITILVFKTDIPTAMVVSACLTPTDPVLSASILENSKFSERIPLRIRTLLKTESGCNDGVAFPFLYIGIYILMDNNPRQAFDDWFMITIMYECVLGTIVGLLIGLASNRVLRFVHGRDMIPSYGLVLFHLFLAVFSIGVASLLGLDDFLVTFGAGRGFSQDGWFAEQTAETEFGHIIDLLLNSGMFVCIGAILPWKLWLNIDSVSPWITFGRLLLFAFLVLVFRRLPFLVSAYSWIPDIWTFEEAFFVGHYGPIGLGGLFCAVLARAVLETGTSVPDPSPPTYEQPYTPQQKAILTVWPVVSFMVFVSTMIHGFSPLLGGPLAMLPGYLWRCLRCCGRCMNPYASSTEPSSSESSETDSLLDDSEPGDGGRPPFYGTNAGSGVKGLPRIQERNVSSSSEESG